MNIYTIKSAGLWTSIIGHHLEGAHGLKNEYNKRRSAFFLWGEHRGLQFINSVKNEPKMYIYFYLYLYHFSLIKMNNEAKK